MINVIDGGLRNFQEYITPDAREAVSRAHRMTPDALFDAVGIVPSHRRSPIVDLRRDDEENVLLMHQPFGNFHDWNRLASLGVAALALPNTRFISVTGSGGLEDTHHTLSAYCRRFIADGNFIPAAIPAAVYVEKQGIDELSVAGNSYAANVGLAFPATEAAKVRSMALYDPASAEATSLLGSALRLLRSQRWVDEYSVSNPRLVQQALERSGSNIPFNFYLGMLTPTNRAAAKGMSRGQFPADLMRAAADPSVGSIDVAYGGATEFGSDILRSMRTAEVSPVSGDRSGTVVLTEIINTHHAATNNVAFSASIAVRAIRDHASM